MTPVRLKLCQVGKSFGNVEVLTDISLSVAAGEFASIIGPSGAGKSTIFKLLIGEQKPDRGQILFDDVVDGW